MASKSKLIFAPGEAPPDSGPVPSQSQAHGQAAQFSLGKLSYPNLDPNPLLQFHTWFSDPRLKGTVPETVCLSTAELPSGRVSSRMLYLKELDHHGGFVVYSNWGTSRKASDIKTNAYVSLCFHWKTLERQVRVEGKAERLTNEESQVYFDTRVRGSRIGAWASRQSSVLFTGANHMQKEVDGKSEHEGKAEEEGERGGEGGQGGEADDGRATLDAQVKEIEQRFAGSEGIPVPDFWGGLRVIPETIEFWQGRDSRLHDRFKYTRTPGVEQDVEDGGPDGWRWKVERLSP